MPNIYKLQGTDPNKTHKQTMREFKQNRKKVKYGVFKLTKKLDGSFGSKND